MSLASTSSRPREVELALGFSRDALPALIRHPAIAAAKRGRAQTSRLTSAYYDTQQRTLAVAGIALRVRRDGNRYLQTVKGPSERASTPALRARAEYEWPLKRRTIDLRALRATPWAALLDRAGRDGLTAQFTTDYVRRTIPIALPGGTRALVCIDVGGIRAPNSRARAPISEIEIELVDGEAGALYAFAQSLATDVPLAILPASKAERGFALASGKRKRPVPERAREISLEGETRAVTALAAIARDCLRHVAANARGAAELADAEWIHQMRVGTRRLRACLALVARLEPSLQVAPVAAGWKSLAGALGEARDFDVVATETLPAIASTQRDASAPLAELDRRIATRRRAARRAVRAAIESRYTQLILATAALLDVLDTSASAQPLREAAKTLLARRHKLLQRRAKRADDGGSDERHAVRIAAKKLRYAAEFFASLYPHDAARRYICALARLQQVLGRENDAIVAERVATELGPAAAAAAVRDHNASRKRSHAAAFRRAWKRFDRVDPPWH